MAEKDPEVKMAQLGVLQPPGLRFLQRCLSEWEAMPAKNGLLFHNLLSHGVLSILEIDGFFSTLSAWILLSCLVCLRFMQLLSLMELL